MTLALAAYAAVTGVTPSSGTAQPGQTITATVTFQSTLADLCPQALNLPTNMTVTFEPGCGPGGLFPPPWQSQMQVVVGPNTTPGDYTINITDLDPLGGLIFQWPLTVTAPPATTTSTTSTTSTTTISTTTPSVTTSTTAAVTTTSPAGVAVVTTRPPTAGAPGNGGGPVGNGSGTDGSGKGGSGGSGPAGAVGIGIAPDDPTGPGTGGGTGAGDPQVTADAGTEANNGDDADAGFSEVAVSSGLIDLVSRAVPGLVAEVVLSPLVVAEILFRALGSTVAGLLFPLAVTLLLGLWLFWALRSRDDEWETDPSLGEALELGGGAG